MKIYIARMLRILKNKIAKAAIALSGDKRSFESG